MAGNLDPWNVTFISPSKAYLFDFKEATHIIWDPSAMEIRGEIRRRRSSCAKGSTRRQPGRDPGQPALPLAVLGGLRDRGLLPRPPSGDLRHRQRSAGRAGPGDPLPCARQPRAPGRAGELLLIVTVSFFAGVALFGPRPLEAPQAPAPVAPAPPAPAVAEDILLTVTVTPAHARFTVDGAPAPANPFSARVPRELATHSVRATAPGFEPREKRIGFTHNVVLDSQPVAAAARAATPAPGAPPRPPARQPRQPRLPGPPAPDRRPIRIEQPLRRRLPVTCEPKRGDGSAMCWRRVEQRPRAPGSDQASVSAKRTLT